MKEKDLAQETIATRTALPDGKFQISITFEDERQMKALLSVIDTPDTRSNRGRYRRMWNALTTVLKSEENVGVVCKTGVIHVVGKYTNSIEGGS